MATGRLRAGLAQTQCISGAAPRPWVVVPVPLPRHVKVGELGLNPCRLARFSWDGFLLLVFCGGFGHSGPTIAAFHRGRDSEAAIPAAGASDD